MRLSGGEFLEKNYGFLQLGMKKILIFQNKIYILLNNILADISSLGKRGGYKELSYR